MGRGKPRPARRKAPRSRAERGDRGERLNKN